MEQADATATHKSCGSLQSPPGTHVVEMPSHVLVQIFVDSSIPALRLLCVSDTHDQQNFMPTQFSNSLKADILIHAGDFTCRGAQDELAAFQAWTENLLAEGVVREIVFIAGNHELTMELKAKNPAVKRNQEAMKNALISQPHLHYMEDSGCEVLGMKFFGVPWSTRFSRDWAFQLADTKDELGLKYDAVPDDIHVLITHQPPLGQGDQNENDKRTGSKTLMDRILRAPPLLHVFGHIHTGHGVSRHDNVHTAFVNAAICDEDYKPIQKPILVEFVHNTEK